MRHRAAVFAVFLLAVVRAATGQSKPLVCASSAVPALVHGEGLAELLGDIVLNCSGGTPRTSISGNLTLFLSVPITNRLSASGALDISLLVDSGSGPMSAGAAPVLVSTSSASFNGVSFTVPPAGLVTLRLTNVRGAVATLGTGDNRPVFASIAFNTTSGAAVSASQFIVAFASRSLLASYSSSGVRCVGSPLPAQIGFSSLLLGGTRFFSTRVTEGYAAAFQRKTPPDDAGMRIIAHYSGFPAGTRLFVPDAVAGSSAAQPTGAGDLGVPPSGGAYTAGSGTLLLIRVAGTDSGGAGGTLAINPNTLTGAVTFDSTSEVPLTSGSGVAVYEVVDSNPNLRESAQFPTFLGLAPITNGTAVTATEDVFLAPISVVTTASATAPTPRFSAVPPISDCSALQDCNAAYFPSLVVIASQPLTYSGFVGSAFQTRYVQINNAGGGLLNWTATITYKNGADWLTVDPPGGVNNGTVRIDALPSKVPAGTYQATLTIDAGPLAGSRTLPIGLTVVDFPPPPPAPKVVLTRLANAAQSDSTQVSPGALALAQGQGLSGKNVLVTFDGTAATILSGDDKQIVIQIPVINAKNNVQLQATVDGATSAPLAVNIAELAPAIFPNGVLNQDYSVNGAASPAAAGSALQIFATGVIAPVPAPVLVKMNDRVLQPLYAGAAPGLIGVNQVNAIIPSDFLSGSVALSVCGFAASAPNQLVCSANAAVAVRLATTP